jgi:hypothetical protein
LFVCRLLLNTAIGVLLVSSPAWSESTDESSVSALQRQGIDYTLKGDYEGATRVSDRLKRRFPDDATGYTLNLNTLITRFSWELSDKQFDSDINKDARFAAEICESRIGSDPTDYRAFHHCGQAHFALAYLHAARGNYYRLAMKTRYGMLTTRVREVLNPMLQSFEIQPPSVPSG